MNAEILAGRGAARRPIPLAWLFGWLALAGGTLLIRPAFPIDESRYLAVAWEMWWRDSFWVPYLNGEYYSGKPPLFFWLMQAGWKLFGVNEWWARAVAPLFGLLNLFLTARLARRLWPKESVAATAPVFLLGAFYWALFSSSTMFDMLLSSFVLLAIHALVRYWQGGSAWNFAGLGVALGLGILAKGPVVFLPVGSVVLLAPWWMNERQANFSWKRWYGGFAFASVLAGCIALCWLIPLAMNTTKEYFLDLTIHQTAGYTVHSFSHRRPFWWYLPLVPVLLFPWSLWPRGWLALRRLDVRRDSGVRLCLAWAGATLLLFSLISGKQAHYLLPAFPAVALLLTHALQNENATDPPGATFAWNHGIPLLVLLLLGGAFAVFPLLSSRNPKLALFAHSDPYPLVFAGLLLMVSALGLIVFVRRHASQTTVVACSLAATTWCALLLGQWGIFHGSWPALDLRVPSAVLAQEQAHGHPLAVRGNYSGEFSFYGRLTTVVSELSEDELSGWARDHPDGCIILHVDEATPLPLDEVTPLYHAPYRGDVLTMWRAADLVSHPELAHLR